MIASTSQREPKLSMRIVGLVRLLRPLNLLLLLSAVIVGGLLAAGTGILHTEAVGRLGLAAFSAALIGGAANSINDYFDLEIDRINRPDRPLPSAMVSPSVAKAVWAVGSAAGVALSLFLTLRHLVLATVAVVLLYLYNVYWKRSVLVGNMAVAFMTALALVYGAWAVGDAGPALAGAAFAFLTTFAREIIKDIEDLRGDRAVAARTAAATWGPYRVASLAVGVLIATVLLTPVPYLLLEYGGLYLLVVLVSDVMMLYAVWCMQRPAKGQWVSRASAAVKTAMALGIAALVLVVVV